MASSMYYEDIRSMVVVAVEWSESPSLQSSVHQILHISDRKISLMPKIFFFPPIAISEIYYFNIYTYE